MGCAEGRTHLLHGHDLVTLQETVTVLVDALKLLARLGNLILHRVILIALGTVLVHPEAFSTTVEPLPSAVETYWLFSEAWAAVTKPGRSLTSLPVRALKLLHTVIHKKDAYFDYTDPLPFLANLYVHLPMLLIRNLIKGNKWAKIDPCIGKLTEENGD